MTSVRMLKVIEAIFSFPRRTELLYPSLLLILLMHQLIVLTLGNKHGIKF